MPSAASEAHATTAPHQRVPSQRGAGIPEHADAPFAQLLDQRPDSGRARAAATESAGARAAAPRENPAQARNRADARGGNANLAQVTDTIGEEARALAAAVADAGQAEAAAGATTPSDRDTPAIVASPSDGAGAADPTAANLVANPAVTVVPVAPVPILAVTQSAGAAPAIDAIAALGTQADTNSAKPTQTAPGDAGPEVTPAPSTDAPAKLAGHQAAVAAGDAGEEKGKPANAGRAGAQANVVQDGEKSTAPAQAPAQPNPQTVTAEKNEKAASARGEHDAPAPERDLRVRAPDQVAQQATASDTTVRPATAPLLAVGTQGGAGHATTTQPATLLAHAADLPVPLSGIAVAIAARALAGGNRFDIRLDPPELGRIDVRLDVDRGGHVTSRLIVERAETLDMLRRDAPHIERALEQAGLKTGENSMQFSLRDQGADGMARGHDDGQKTAAQALPTDEPAVAGAPTTYARLFGRIGGIDIRV
ncbi:MAG: flagellar hook-length control protein FliK [Proteobacteria bacterium]|nr:flagellar hook-length control protein FliK [Pseudomonadota bacterium]